MESINSDQPPPIPSLDGERWLEIPELPGYWVSDHGRVFSYRTASPRILKPRIIGGGRNVIRQKTNIRGEGYPAVALCGRDHQVHRLVLTLFKGPCPPGQEACHNDGNPQNNHINNLRWDTRLANNADKRLHGRAAQKLNPEMVRAIRKMRQEGGKLKDIARFAGVTHPVVYAICSGRIWQHVV